nr:hypothetical protein [Deinococcus planocerae]
MIAGCSAPFWQSGVDEPDVIRELVHGELHLLPGGALGADDEGAARVSQDAR